MKITLISNYLNHHQMPLCESFLGISGVEFTFIATMQVLEERIMLGYQTSFDHLSYYREAIEPKDIAEAEQLCFDSDVLICGEAPRHFITRRLRAHKLTFNYNERWFKRGFWRHPGDVYRAIRAFSRFNNPNYYQLCASAYTAYDSRRVFAFPSRKLRWGYFPAVKKHNIFELMEKKQPASMLWVARFLDWKHPEKAVEVARRLKEEGYDFRLSMIGSGPMEEPIRTLIKQYGLEDCVCLLGSMPPEQVREHMERSRIFLFTSDFGEGWGAVLNESMNSGCAVVASHAIGSAPYLIHSGKNGLIYKNDDMEQLYQHVKRLLLDDALAQKLGTEAYKTMIECWNGSLAAQRLHEFAEAKLMGAALPVYSDGPMSYDDGKVRNNG